MAFPSAACPAAVVETTNSDSSSDRQEWPVDCQPVWQADYHQLLLQATIPRHCHSALVLPPEMGAFPTDSVCTVEAISDSRSGYCHAESDPEAKAFLSFFLFFAML